MEEPTLFLRIIGVLFVFCFVVVMICCNIGLQRAFSKYVDHVRPVALRNPAKNFKEYFYRRRSAEDKEIVRHHRMAFFVEWRFWGFFLALDILLFWVFYQTFPGF